MDAGTAGSGFDAALKALEALEDDVQREKAAVTPSEVAAGPVISFEDPCDPIEDETVKEAAPAAPSETETLDAATASSLAQVAPATEAPPEHKEAPQPEKTKKAKLAIRKETLPVVAAGMGVFASLLSVVGLIVATRTVNEASLVVADARERQAQLVQVGKLVHDLELVRKKQIELLALQHAAVQSSPATKDEVYAAIDALKLQMGRRAEDDPVVKQVHDGQSELADMITMLGSKLVRIDAAVNGRRGSDAHD